MQSSDFIESGIVFGLNTRAALTKFKYSKADFQKHGDAYRFIVDHFDTYGEIPSIDALCENYPTLDPSAQSLNLDYALDAFQNQLLFRNIVSAFQSNKELVSTEPKQALSKIMATLGDIELVYDEDVIEYSNKADKRLDLWKDRKKRRKMGGGLMGVPTSFNSINSTGVGWMPGELISLYARPTVGKTWLCVHAAATAAVNGFRTLLISTEMPVEAISLRTDVVLANMMGYNLSHRALRNGDEIDEEEYRIFLQAIEDQQLLVCDHIEGASSITVDSIASLIRKHSPDFVVIDGIYLVSTGINMKKAMWEQSHAVFYGMKNLCLSTNTPIFVSTQATRDAAANMFAPPRPDQVAFGDALIRASDVAMAMAMVEGEDQKRLVQYQKYRDGQLQFDASLLDWDVNKGNIKEIPYEEQIF
tara:strand:- start:1718 stop:2968 length:1251 start_codon:yes stop_codon:yes gene_type:complete